MDTARFGCLAPGDQLTRIVSPVPAVKWAGMERISISGPSFPGPPFQWPSGNGDGLVVGRPAVHACPLITPSPKQVIPSHISGILPGMRHGRIHLSSPPGPIVFERGQCRHHPGTRRCSANMPDGLRQCYLSWALWPKRFEHTMGASACEYPALTEKDHAIPCHRYLVDLHMQTGGLHRSLRRHFSGVPRGVVGLSLSSRTSPGLSDSLSEGGAVFPALLGLSQGSLRAPSRHPSPHQTRLGEQPVSSPSPPADPQKPHGKHQGYMLRRDTSTPRKALSARRGLFYFLLPPALSPLGLQNDFYTSPKVACAPCTKSQTAPPTAPSFPLCRVRPFSWGRSRSGRDFHFFSPVPPPVIDVLSAPLPRDNLAQPCLLTLAQSQTIVMS
jgi:hypothetical protein